MSVSELPLPRPHVTKFYYALSTSTLCHIYIYVHVHIMYVYIYLNHWPNSCGPGAEVPVLAEGLRGQGLTLTALGARAYTAMQSELGYSGELGNYDLRVYTY